AWLTLRTPWWCICQNGDVPKTHRHGLIHQRRDDAGIRRVTLPLVRSVVADAKHVERDDTAFLGKPNLHPTANAGPRSADEVLLLTTHAHHHRRVGLFCKESGDDERNRTRDLAAKSSASVFTDHDDITGVKVHPSSNAQHSLRSTLRSRMDVQL